MRQNWFSNQHLHRGNLENAWKWRGSFISVALKRGGETVERRNAGGVGSAPMHTSCWETLIDLTVRSQYAKIPFINSYLSGYKRKSVSFSGGGSVMQRKAVHQKTRVSESISTWIKTDIIHFAWVWPSFKVAPKSPVSFSQHLLQSCALPCFLLPFNYNIQRDVQFEAGAASS